MSKRLYDCTTAVERLEWIKSRLEAGHTVSQNALEIGGVVNPHGVIGGLRASGMRIEQIAIDRVDAKGSLHYGVTAWRLLPSPIGREAARSTSQHANATIKHHRVPELKTEA
jgi:hypothetical protein